MKIWEISWNTIRLSIRRRRCMSHMYGRLSRTSIAIRVGPLRHRTPDKVVASRVANTNDLVPVLVVVIERLRWAISFAESRRRAALPVAKLTIRFW